MSGGDPRDVVLWGWRGRGVWGEAGHEGKGERDGWSVAGQGSGSTQTQRQASRGPGSSALGDGEAGRARAAYISCLPDRPQGSLPFL